MLSYLLKVFCIDFFPKTNPDIWLIPLVRLTDIVFLLASTELLQLLLAYDLLPIFLIPKHD
jgi:hypothetical protein